MTTNCDWHKNENPLTDYEIVGCPECGRMIHTKICDSCGKEFLDWNHRGWDDIMAGPAATSSGDFCCTHCLPRIEAEWERQEEEDDLDFEYGADPYDCEVEE